MSELVTNDGQDRIDRDLLASRGLTIFFPAWNEAEGIERAVRAAVGTAEGLIRDGEVAAFEVLVVDDASTDATAEIVDRLARSDARVRVVRHETNRKLGGALKTGFASARGAWFLYTDADLPFDMAEIGKAFRLMNHYEADIVAMYRHDRIGEGLRRLVYSYFYNALVRRVFGLRIRDVNFAGKLIRREVLETVNLHSEGSFIDVELLSKAERSGFRIIQFGVDYFPRSRGVSTLSSASVILTILKEMRTLLPEIRSTGSRVSRP